MKKKLIPLLLTFALVIGGCSSSDTEYSYINANKNSDSECTYISTEASRAESVADNVCVIDTYTKNDDKDAAINVGSAVLFNINDNEVLYNKNTFAKMYPASTTKILTVYCALKYADYYNVDFNKDITVTDCVNNMVAGAKLSGFLPGDTVKLEDVLYCTILESGNDAALILAENITGSVDSFVALMNNEAKRIGATHSNFCNPHGLFEDNHYTTAYDLYLIFNEAVKLDKFREYLSADSHSFSYTTASGITMKRTISSTNQYKTGKADAPAGVTVIGGKTGYEELAGRCLVLLSQKDNKDYISIILNAETTDDLYKNMNKLLEKE